MTWDDNYKKIKFEVRPILPCFKKPGGVLLTFLGSFAENISK